jgi:hypothetical protein
MNVDWKTGVSKQINRLTAAFVKKAGPGMHCDGGGLWLKVTEGADGLNRSWVFRFAVGRRDAQLLAAAP